MVKMTSRGRAKMGRSSILLNYGKWIILCGLAAWVPYAHPQDSSGLDREISRFLRLYRVGEMQHIALESIFRTAVKNNRINEDTATCVLHKLPVGQLAESARPIIESYFKDEVTLRAINDFFATSAGQRSLDHAEGAHRAAMEAIAVGRTPPPMKPHPYSQEELSGIHAWEQSAAFAEFKRFVNEGLRTISPTHSNAFKSALSACQTK